MKILLPALVGIAISASASANHLHSNACPKDCAVKSTAIAPVAKSYDKKVAELNEAAENKAGLLNYNKAMQLTLNQIDKQKHLNAIENIESQNAYNTMMANMVETLEQQKLADQLEDLSASQRFEELMVSVILETASK